MGNIDSRSKFEGGHLYVKTDRPYYYPGNEVFGKIYIRTFVPMDPSHMEIKVKGKEKASYKRFEQHTRTDADGTTHNEERMIIEKFE